MKKTIVGIGEILWDIFPDRKALGGAPANFAYHCMQLGHEAYAISAIGKDPLGEEIKKELANKGLQHNLQEVSYPTGKVLVTLAETGSGSYDIQENVAWDHISFTQELEQLAHRTDAVCFGSLAQRSEETASTIHRFLAAMPAESIKIFDINLRLNYYSEALIRSSLEHATMLKLNDEEVSTVALLLKLDGSIEAVCHQVLELFALDSVILTRGAYGCNIYTAGGRNYHPSKEVSVIDTVGAGDSFTAAYVSALLAGRSRPDAIRFSTQVAAFVCTQRGAMPALPPEYRMWLEE
nr:carbohydrate kinase [uncultured Porphyromonas sp.]